MGKDVGWITKWLKIGRLAEALKAMKDRESTAPD